jgi:hydroxymethylglutaryl-CoA reductase
MTRRGGGYRGLEASWLQESRCIRVELIVDVRDAMGANLVNTAAEAISPLMEKLCGGTKLMAILSNQAEKRCASAEFVLPFGALQRGSYKGRELAERIVRLWQIADEDPARAVTHNKGIMNGISSLALATANDTRATEAAAHAWAARDGHYRSLSKFWIEGENLRGRLELPLALGTVGGASASTRWPAPPSASSAIPRPRSCRDTPRHLPGAEFLGRIGPCRRGYPAGAYAAPLKPSGFFRRCPG